MPPLSPPSAPPPPRGVALGLAAVGAAVVLAYARTGAVPFVFDDYGSIVANDTLEHLGALGRVLTPPHAAGATVGGRPLLNLSFAVDYALSGRAVWSYHVTNLLIHLGGTLLLFGVLRRTLASLGATRPPVTALAITAVWALHPLQTESVTYLSQRAESLAGFWYLLTFYAFIRATDRGPDARSGRRAGGWLALSAAACLLGVGVKEIVGTAPVLVLLWDRLAVAGSFAGAWRRRWGYYAALLASWLVLGALIATTESRGGTAGLGTPVSSWSYLLTQSRAIMHYLRLVVWPTPLVFDYGSAVAHGFGDVWPWFLALTTALAAALIVLRRAPYAAFLVLAFFILLAPSSSVVPIASQTLAEHRMYLPLAVVLTGGLLILQARLGRAALVLFFAAAAVCAVLTWQRNEMYRSPEMLWAQTVAAVPDNARAHNDLGNALVAVGKSAEARAQYEAALRLQPDYADAQSNLGHALVQAGQPEQALAHLRTAVRLNPRSPEILTNLGIALAATGRFAEAIATYQKALSLAPGSVDALYDMGNALYQARDFTRAATTYQALLATHPAHHDARFNLAYCDLQLNRPRDALREFEQVLAHDPGDADAHAEAGNILAQLGEPAAAIPHFEAALRLKPAFPAVQSRLAAARAAVAGLK